MNPLKTGCEMKLVTKPIWKIPIASCNTPTIKARSKAREIYSEDPGSAMAETEVKVRSAMSAGGPTGMWREVPNRP